MHRFLRLCFARQSILGWLVLTCCPGQASAAAAPIQFSRDILPVLSDRCFQCHGPDAQQRKGKLRLDDEAAAKAPIEGRAPIVPGNRQASEVYRRLVTTDLDDRMPPLESHKTVSPEEIALIGRWIDEGATWSVHWAFAPLRRPPVPTLPPTAGRVHNPIDAFVLDRLVRADRIQAPAADGPTLLRRLSLDLTGLPPTLAAQRAWPEPPSAVDVARLIESLLALPAYGERMAWDWLEAARYADSNGYQGDAERTMWPWRDWVVSAFNRNMPYDQFTLWQLAGDLLPQATQEQRLATGFCRNHPINGEGGRIAEENRVDYGLDMTETMGTVWLGLTLNCARCHDHKFDPISRRDYYSLFAYFNQTPVDGAGGDPQSRPNLELPTPAQTASRQEFKARLAEAALAVDLIEDHLFPHSAESDPATSPQAGALPEPIRAILRSPADRRTRAQLTELEKDAAPRAPGHAALLKRLRQLHEERDQLERTIARVMVMEDRTQARPTFMLDKGLYHKPGDPVIARTPERLPPSSLGTNRLALAQWLVSEENPLTARVTVNRVWQMFFGVGLVKTAEDFGIQAETPLHPALLDWLACELRDSHWDLKHLVRIVVSSATYQQSSRLSPEAVANDPENRWLARGPRFRLPSWMIRDQALAASGLLRPELGGPPVKPYQPAGVWEEATFGNKRYVPDRGDALYRRSLYVFWRRIVGPTLFFDTPSRATCNVKPTRTNIPLHALATLNDVTYVEAARHLAERAMAPDSTPAQRLEQMFRSVLARAPKAEEQTLLEAALIRTRAQYAAAPAEAEQLLQVGDSPPSSTKDPVEWAALTSVGLTLLNLDESLTKE